MSATISVYISTLNPLFWQATIEATIRQSLLFADEVVVADGGSTDGTIELVEGMREEDARIWLYHYDDNYENGQSELANRRNFALSKCTSDFAVLQDDDEMVHESYVARICSLPDDHPEAIAFRFPVMHFYRSWNHYRVDKGWYLRKVYMVENIPQIQHGAVGSGVDVDPDNYVLNRKPLESQEGVIDTDAQVFHYGHCRSDTVMLLKKYFQEVSWWGPSYWDTHEFPFQFEKPDGLQVFTGMHPRYMSATIKAEGKRRWLQSFDNGYVGFPWAVDEC